MNWTKRNINYLFAALIFRGFFVFFLSGCGSDSINSTNTKTQDTISVRQPYLQFSPARDSLFKNYFTQLAKRGQFNGVALIFEKDSLFSAALGKKRLADTALLDTADLFQLGSVSKPITAFGLLHLLEKEEIGLDEKVNRFLPHFYDHRITIGQLLTHTSGLGNYLYMTDSLWKYPDSAISNEEVLCFFDEGLIPAYHSPGSRFDYCNSNYALIASLVQVISGKPFRQFMQENIFIPLGMHGTHYVDMNKRNSLDYPVYGHYPNGKKKLPLYVNGVVGDKGLYSSCQELLKFYREIQNPTLISSEMRDLAFSETAETGKGEKYGLGWRIGEFQSKRLVYHNGWWRGFRAYFWMVPDMDLAVIITTNQVKGKYLSRQEILNMIKPI